MLLCCCVCLLVCCAVAVPCPFWNVPSSSVFPVEVALHMSYRDAVVASSPLVDGVLDHLPNVAVAEVVLLGSVSLASPALEKYL
eukprot:2741812-Pyramimonas_sp.AAC.1